MLGCVVAGEAVRRRVEEQLELWDIEPHWVVPSAARGRPARTATTTPAGLGADRWVALAGARWRVLSSTSPGQAAAGAGGDGGHGRDGGRAGRRAAHFLGGLILPGFGLMQRALEHGHRRA